MFSKQKLQEYYNALLAKDAAYEGVFFVGVKTTSVFCRPSCPARKPNFENCEFFETAQQALLASYRPCKRCRPLSHPSRVPELVRKLVEAVEANPEKRWKERDFQELSTNAAQARRFFQKRLGMTFIEYARARRMGIALKQIRENTSVIDAQVSIGYESGSGFRDAFSRIMGAAPVRAGEVFILYATWLDTPLGPMLAIGDESALYLLEFVDRRGLEREIERLRKKTRSAIIPGWTEPLRSIEAELIEYFRGARTQFTAPIRMLWSPFQKQVWKALQKIPSGTTQTYTDIARSIRKPTAVRAVANANGANQLAIVIPCHRVINLNGKPGGYGGGSARKQWLLNLEKAHG